MLWKVCKIWLMVINILHSVNPTDADGWLAAQIFETRCLEGLAVMHLQAVVLWKFIHENVTALEDAVSVCSQTRE